MLLLLFSLSTQIGMSIYHSTKYCNVIRFDISLASKSILTIQKLIYLATRKYQSNQVSRYQRKLLCLKEEILLVSLYQVIKNIKKKGIYQVFTTINS